MLAKLFNWLLGKKATTTIAGVVAGAATGAAATAAQGGLTREALIAGAATGAAAAVVGVGGRGHGES
ncbi:MAG: hypothetical protein J7K75_08490 [Desulfuromonas sp.]|nr:hypothetical protein [Desulfuromonas sp.]